MPNNVILRQQQPRLIRFTDSIPIPLRKSNLFLLGSRLKSLSIKTPLAAGKTPITDARTDELFDAIKDGHEGATDEFVNGMLQLTIHIAGQYARFRRKETDELVSLGLLGLTKGIQKLRDGKARDRNLKGLCILTIHSECASALKAPGVYGPGIRTVIKHPEQAVTRVELAEIDYKAKVGKHSIADVMEVVHLLDQVERVIFDMILEGWELPEIAVEVGQSYKRIYRTWQVAKGKITKALEDAEA